MKKFCFVLCVCLQAVMLHAAKPFLAEGGYYKKLSKNTVELVGLDTIVLENNVLTIRSKVEYNGQVYTVTRIGDYALCHSKYGKKKCTFMENLDLVLEEGIKNLGSHQFYHVGFHSITLPNSLEEIGDYVFEDCNLKSGYLKLPEGLRKIGDHAFEAMDIERLELPESLEYIGKLAFAGNSFFVPEYDQDGDCRRIKIDTMRIPLSDWYISERNRRYTPEKLHLLNEPEEPSYGNNPFYEEKDSVGEFLMIKGEPQVLYIPANVSHIGAGAFNGTQLKGFEVAKGNTHFCSIDGVLFSKDTTVLYAHPAGRGARTYTTPLPVKRIAEYAFSRFTEYAESLFPYSRYHKQLLSKLILTDNVTEISEEALSGAMLDTLIIGPNVKDGSGANAYDAMKTRRRDWKFMTKEQVRNSHSLVLCTSDLKYPIHPWYAFDIDGCNFFSALDPDMPHTYHFQWECICINYTYKENGFYYYVNPKGKTEWIWADDTVGDIRIPEGIEIVNFNRVFENSYFGLRFSRYFGEEKPHRLYIPASVKEINQDITHYAYHYKNYRIFNQSRLFFHEENELTLNKKWDDEMNKLHKKLKKKEAKYHGNRYKGKSWDAEQRRKEYERRYRGINRRYLVECPAVNYTYFNPETGEYIWEYNGKKIVNFVEQ